MGKPNYPCFENTDPYREYSDPVTTTTSTSTTLAPEDVDFFIIPDSGALCPKPVTTFQDEDRESCPGIDDKLLLVCNSISYNPNPCIREVNKYIKVANVSINVDDCARYKVLLRDLSFPTTATTTIGPTTTTTISPQPQDPDLVLVFDTTKAFGNYIAIPLYGPLNCTINWGDGSSESHINGGIKNHTYPAPGIYTVRISGFLTGFGYGTFYSPTHTDKLVKCLSFGNIGLTNIAYGFYRCRYLNECPTYLPPSINDIRWLFGQCQSFNYPIGSWNTSNITDMSALFVAAYSFNQPLNSWNVSSVTNMSNMFSGTSFDQPLNSWNTSNVTDMSYMFNSSNFNQDISSWNTSNVLNMSYMFAPGGQFGSRFNQNLSTWDIRKVEQMTNFIGQWSYYDQALISWSQLNSLKQNVEFSTESTYSFSAISARNTLINTYNWTITDGGLL